MTDFTTWSTVALDDFIQERYAALAALRRQLREAECEAAAAAKELRKRLVV